MDYLPLEWILIESFFSLYITQKHFHFLLPSRVILHFQNFKPKKKSVLGFPNFNLSSLKWGSSLTSYLLYYFVTLLLCILSELLGIERKGGFQEGTEFVLEGNYTKEYQFSGLFLLA